jgi:hypothetical protein
LSDNNTITLTTVAEVDDELVFRFFRDVTLERANSNNSVSSTFTANGSANVFFMDSHATSNNNVLVTIDGVVLIPVDDYTVDGPILTINYMPPNGAKIEARTITGGGDGGGATLGFVRDSFVGDGNTVNYTLTVAPYDEDNCLVYVDRVLQRNNEYNVSTTTLTFDSAPDANAVIDVFTTTYKATSFALMKAGDTMTGNLNVSATLITQNVEPVANVTYDLGTSTKRFKDLWLSNSTIYLGEATISANGGNIVVPSIQTSSGVNVEAVLADAYNQANSAFDAANNRVLKAGDTMTGLLNVANNLVVTGNVAIGVSSTSNTVQINAEFPTIRLEETGSGGSKRLEFSVANDGVALISAGQSSQSLAFGTVGSERMRIGSNGAVLVGTTSDPTGGTTQHFFSHSGNNPTAFIIGDANNSANATGLYLRSTDPRLVRPTGMPIYIADTAGTKHVTVLGDGKLGIGTTNPSAQLFVASSETGYTANLAETVTKAAVLFKTHSSDSTVTSFGGISGGNAYIQRTNGAGTTSYSICLNPFGGNIGIGTTSPSSVFHMKGAASADATLTIETSANNDYAGIISFADAGGSSASIFYSHYSSVMVFNVAGGERLRINSDGNIGISTTSPANRLDIWSPDGEGARFRIVTKTSGTSSFQQIALMGHTGSTVNDGFFQLFDNGTAKISMAANASRGGDTYFNTGGYLYVGKTSDSNDVGLSLGGDGFFRTIRNGAANIICDRLSNDGDLIIFRQDGNSEGSISVSGSAVSYNGGHLARWSQTTDNTRIELLKGTVMSNLDQMAEWIDPETGEPQQNEQLNCMKVSDVEGDVNVAGVFVNWDNDDDVFANDMNIAMTGDMIIRIAQGVTVQRGDLLMSAGDGTAKPQGDDIIRSKTIAKVTSTHVTCTYEDGSYCVPCVLMAC